jgi:hypothetical protein
LQVSCFSCVREKNRARGREAGRQEAGRQEWRNRQKV